MSKTTVFSPVQTTYATNTSFEPLTNPQMIDIPEMPEQDTGSEDKYADMADVFGKSAQYLFALGRGYYWDATANAVKKGSIVCGEEPVLSRQEKRMLKRKATNALKKAKKHEKNLWENLKDLLDSAYKTESGEMALSKEKLQRIHDILADLGQNNILRFFLWYIREVGEEMSSDPDLRQKYLTNPHAFTRDRQILLSDVLLFLMTMAGDSMNHEVYEYFKMSLNHPSAPAMIERRSLLTAEGVEYFMNRLTKVCQTICDNLPPNQNITGPAAQFHSILACDGSGINVACNPDDKDTHVSNQNGRKPYNQYHLNSIRDFCSGLFVSNILQGINSLNENGAATDMVRNLKQQKRTLFTGDRGYGSLNLIHTIALTPNIDCLIRVKESWILETRRLPLETCDVNMTVHIVTTQRKCDKKRFKDGTAKYMSGKSKFGKYKASQTWDYSSETDVTFRVVRFQLENGAWETLVTTLSQDEFSIEDLKALYFMRWQNIENAFRVLKWDNHLSQMHSKKDNSARQEIFARLAMHNLVSCIIRIAESLEATSEAIHCANGTAINYKEEKENKNPLIINRRFATHLICDYLKNADALSFDVIEVLLRHKTPVRKGRSFKRDLRTISFVSFLYR